MRHCTFKMAMCELQKTQMQKRRECIPVILQKKATLCFDFLYFIAFFFFFFLFSFFNILKCVTLPVLSIHVQKKKQQQQQQQQMSLTIFPHSHDKMKLLVH